MQQHNFLSVVLIFLILVVGSIQPVLADSAPPQYPPGASIGSGGFETNVQMVSEDVLMIVSEVPNSPEDREMGHTADYVQIRVEATFWMQNQGDEIESFEVWFPLSDVTGYANASNVENFAAWVDDVPAELGREESPGRYVVGSQVPWATWPVTFPPGETIVLSVVYDLRATGYMPFGYLYYILETGAGWWDNIGEGTVTIRLPYQVHECNISEFETLENMDSVEVNGTDLIWRFSNLEPTEDDNIRVWVMAPSRWQAILDAEENLTANPDSSEAYRELAQAQVRGLLTKGGPACGELANAALENFQQALALDPENIDALYGYGRLLLSRSQTHSDQLSATMVSFLALAPNDERTLDLLIWVLMEYEYSLLRRHPHDETIRAELQDIEGALQVAAKANPENEWLPSYARQVSRLLNPDY